MAIESRAVENALDRYMSCAFEDVEIMQGFDSSKGERALQLFKAIKREGLKLLDKEYKEERTRIRRLMADGNRLILLVDSQLPVIRRRARENVGVHDTLGLRDQQILRRMERTIPANKKIMLAAA